MYFVLKSPAAQLYETPGEDKTRSSITSVDARKLLVLIFSFLNSWIHIHNSVYNEHGDPEFLFTTGVVFTTGGFLSEPFFLNTDNKCNVYIYYKLRLKRIFFQWPMVFVFIHITCSSWISDKTSWMQKVNIAQS